MRKNKNLLWEIGTEELPARFILPALENLKLWTEKKLRDNHLKFDHIKTAGTLRRLTIFVKNLSEVQEEREEQIIGPSVEIGLDEKGNYTPALIGFVKKYGAEINQLIIKQTEKGRYFCLKRKITGKKTIEILPQILIEILQSIDFPKSMRWNNYQIKFARPIRWMVCLYGNQIVPFKLANISSSNLSKGHRFLSKEPLKFTTANWKIYEKTLEKNYVIVDPEKRFLLTKQKILEISKGIGYPEMDKELIEENANLVEYPFPILGKFSRDFLNLPEPLIITALKEHQRYICLRDENNRLINYFIAVNNNLPKDLNVLIRGHERVTQARLEDAKFYFEKDLKESLDKKVEKLKGIIYHIKCGTLWDKTQRLIKLGKYLGKKIGFKEKLEDIEKACFYAKADLSSEVIKEFPSLQGIIGSIYAKYFGEEKIAKAIYEQYLPSSKDENLPKTKIGTILSLADKIDHLCALFGCGEKPTGETDPYGLRRTAYGIIKILIGKKLFLNLEESINYGLEILKNQNFLKESNAFSEILEFLKKRLEGEFLNLGFNKALIGVVIDLPSFDPFDIYLRIKTLKEFQEKEEFINLIIGFKRAFQILKGLDFSTLPLLNPEIFNQEEEKNLYLCLLKTKPELEIYLSKKNYNKYLETLLKFKENIDGFFEKVFVMVEQKEIRENRLKLLSEVVSLFNSFGNFSSLV